MGCRTSVWVECQVNPECRLIVHVDHHYERDESASAPRGKSGGRSASIKPDTEFDYPYVCSSGNMLEHVVSVQTNILAARQRAKALIIENAKDTNTTLSVSMIAAIIALVTFISLVIGMAIKNKMHKKVVNAETTMLNDAETATTYATFF